MIFPGWRVLRSPSMTPAPRGPPPHRKTARCGSPGACVRSIPQDGVRDPADPHLERGPVWNQPRHVPCDPARQLRGIPHGRFREGIVHGKRWWVIFETWMNASPSVRGMFGLTSAMTILAEAAAVLVTPTSTPNEQNPCSSGRETWIKAASSGRWPFLKSPGISDRKQGVKSARPSLTLSGRCR